jgi:ribulose bisphosphate carboxylase small subunit
MGSVNYKQAIKPDTAKLKKIIEASLLCDWVVRIEYENGQSQSANWQQWEKPFFALRTANTVLTALVNCYTKHPHYVIRICAEKISPKTRMLYTVYDPRYLNENEVIRPEVSSPQHQGRRGDSISTTGVTLRDQS